MYIFFTFITVLFLWMSLTWLRIRSLELPFCNPRVRTVLIEGQIAIRENGLSNRGNELQSETNSRERITNPWERITCWVISKVGTDCTILLFMAFLKNLHVSSELSSNMLFSPNLTYSNLCFSFFPLRFKWFSLIL